MPDSASHSTVPCTAAEVSEPLFDAERLDVYHLALEFQGLATTLAPRRGQAALRDQLDRASVSIALNIAEGAGRFSPADKARFYGIARGSAMECAAVIDVLHSRGVISAAAHRRSRTILLRIVQMLTRLNTSMMVSAR